MAKDSWLAATGGPGGVRAGGDGWGAAEGGQVKAPGRNRRFGRGIGVAEVLLTGGGVQDGECERGGYGQAGEARGGDGRAYWDQGEQ